jgi:hypothetical protein
MIGAVFFISLLGTTISFIYLYKLEQNIKEIEIIKPNINKIMNKKKPLTLEEEIDLITFINTNKNKLI